MENFKSLTWMIATMNPEGTYTPLGTCFLLPKAGKFVTCHHVIGNSTSNFAVLSAMQDVNGYQDTCEKSCLAAPVKVEEINTINDIAILSLPEQDTAHSLIELGSLDEIEIGDTVEIWGYPHCVNDAKMRILTCQTTKVGAKVLRESQSIMYKYAILNIQTRPGQSGSLVYCERINKIVGMVVGCYAPNCGISLGGINPFELNQTSFCISAEYIKEML